MHTTTYTIPGRDEAYEALVQGPAPIPRRRQPRGRQAIPNAEARAQRARLLLAKCICV